MHDKNGGRMPSNENIVDKQGLREEVAIEDLIKGAFGLAAAKGAVQVFPNSMGDDYDEYDGSVDQAPILPDTSDSPTDLKVRNENISSFSPLLTNMKGQLCVAGIHKALLKLGLPKGAGSLSCKEAVTSLLTTLNTILESETYLLLQVP